MEYYTQTFVQSATGKKKRNNNCDDFNGTMKQRSQANARERDRTHRERRPLLADTTCKQPLTHVNSAFTTLRTLIPTEPKDRKLSKIETLRLASSYISHLGSQLIAGPVDQPCLRVSKEIDINDLNNPNRHQQSVCTFCIAHKKSSNRLPTIEDYSSCGNSMETQAIFYTQTSLQHSIGNSPVTELQNIYY